MGMNLECAFNLQTTNEFHSIVTSSRFITFMQNIDKLKEKPMTTKRDIICSKLQVFRIPKLKETYLVYVLFKCNYNYVTTPNYDNKNHKLKQKNQATKSLHNPSGIFYARFILKALELANEPCLKCLFKGIRAHVLLHGKTYS
jgi:hypothetical protein